MCFFFSTGRQTERAFAGRTGFSVRIDIFNRFDEVSKCVGIKLIRVNIIFNFFSTSPSSSFRDRARDSREDIFFLLLLLSSRSLSSSSPLFLYTG